MKKEREGAYLAMVLNDDQSAASASGDMGDATLASQTTISGLTVGEVGTPPRPNVLREARINIGQYMTAEINSMTVNETS